MGSCGEDPRSGWAVAHDQGTWGQLCISSMATCKSLLSQALPNLELNATEAQLKGRQLVSSTMAYNGVLGGPYECQSPGNVTLGSNLSPGVKVKA